MVLGIQVLGVLFGLFMIYITFLHKKRKEFTVKEYIFWIGAWIVFIIVALYPGILDFIVESLGFVRTMDLFIVVGFMFLIAITFHSYTITRKNQKKVEDVVRKVAIERAGDSGKDSGKEESKK